MLRDAKRCFLSDFHHGELCDLDPVLAAVVRDRIIRVTLVAPRLGGGASFACVGALVVRALHLHAQVLPPLPYPDPPAAVSHRLRVLHMVESEADEEEAAALPAVVLPVVWQLDAHKRIKLDEKTGLPIPKKANTRATRPAGTCSTRTTALSSRSAPAAGPAAGSARMRWRGASYRPPVLPDDPDPAAAAVPGYGWAPAPRARGLGGGPAGGGAGPAGAGAGARGGRRCAACAAVGALCRRCVPSAADPT